MVKDRTTELEKANKKLQEEIYERKKVQQELVKAKEVAEEANAAKSIFLANMSHEFRTPLNSILGFSQILNKEKKLTLNQKKKINYIYSNGKHLLMLINDVLEMSKIEAGKITYTEFSFDLFKLIDDLKIIFNQKIENKDVILNFYFTNDIPRFIKTDEIKLKQILINLLNNSVKFTEKGYIKVFLKSKLTKNQSNKIYFEVQDTGCGIDKNEIESIFEPFEQSKIRQKNHEGTGLGLTITKKHIELLGGKISVVSHLGKGSTFKFNITCKKAKEVEVNFEAKDKIVTKIISKNNKKYHILIVDDIEINRLLLREILEDIGFEVDEAKNGQIALEKIKKWSPDLIFMDRKMPIMNGDEVIENIRKTPNGKKIKIIALTGAVFDEEKKEKLNSGADDFVTKPFTEEEVLNKIKNLLDIEYEYEEY